MGEEWARLWDTVEALWSGRDLDADERAWLLDLLSAIGAGDDVGKRFFRNGKPSPEQDRHFWIAADHAVRARENRSDRGEAAELAVARAWGVEPENVRKIVQRQRKNIESVAGAIERPGFAAVVEWHRSSLSKT